MTGDEHERAGKLGRFLGRTSAAAPPAPPTSPRVDLVSGLADRSHLVGWANEAVLASLPSSNRAVVAFIDIGLLRDVNDSFGPDAGDRLLREVATRLSSIDLPGTRCLRYGGAEFAVVFQGIRNLDQAHEIAHFLVELLTPPFAIGPEPVAIAPMVGAAISADSHNDRPNDLVRDAHQALVRAREQGFGAVEVVDDSRRGRYATRIDEDRLFKALENDEFFLVYQPVVRLDTQQVVGVEALLRWRAPGATNVGMLYPHDFLPLLEKSGLSVAVGKFVIRTGCEQLATWRAELPDVPPLFMSCNLGPRQLAEFDFAQTVLDAVTGTGIAPGQLCLDITDEALRFNQSGVWTALRSLKDHGVRIGLDNFGTGVSNLVWLRDLRVDVLRIDRTFVAGLRAALAAGFGLDQEDAVIIRHLAALAHDLELVAIAEGIESEIEAGAMAELGVDFGQGFHFGRPESADVIADLIAPNRDHGPDEWDTSQVLGPG